MNEDSVFKPKKRIFMALTSISAVLGALMFLCGLEGNLSGAL